MPTVLSKIKNRVYGREWSFPYNCYEVGHGWTPYCSQAALDVGASGFTKVLPLYTSLYLFTQLGLQRKFSPQAFFETFKSILTSASFLGFNLYAGVGVSCLLRNNSDRYYYRIQCLMPGLIASYLALLIERPGRRPALAFYMANMSSELLFKKMVLEGYMRPLPKGETLLFMLGMACWLRFVRIHGFGHDPVSTALKYLLGPLEAKSRARTRNEARQKMNDDKIDESQQLIAQQQQSGDISKQISGAKMSTLQELDKTINAIFNQFFGAHECCPHKNVSCAYYVISPTVTRFTWGYLGRSIVNLATKFRTIHQRPKQTLSEAFFSRNSVNMGLFLASCVGLSRACHCAFRRYSGKQEDWHSLAAGAISGTSMLWSPKSTLSIYVIWKCLEQYFFLAVQNGQIKYPEQFICLVYALSVNTLLYIFAIEPSFIRPSYMKFIDNISDHRLHQVNRMVLDVFGPRASLGYEDWFPDLEPKYMSREFHELIFNWLIQPH